MFHLDKYMDSSAIRRKSFKLEEQAALIIMSQMPTIEEKIRDLQKLGGSNDEESLYICEHIKAVIQLWEEILNDRFFDEGVVFLAALQEKNSETDRLAAYRHFSTYQNALKFLSKEQECYQNSEDFRNTETYGEIWRMELDTDDPECDIYYFDHELRMNKILCCSDRLQKVSLKYFEGVYERLCEYEALEDFQ